MDACPAGDAVLDEREVEEMLKLFRLLANPTRLKIALLIRDRERCVCELERALGIDQTLISHHLRSFKELGAVEERRDWKWRYYRLRDERLKRLLTLLARSEFK